MDDNFWLNKPQLKEWKKRATSFHFKVPKDKKALTELARELVDLANEDYLEAWKYASRFQRSGFLSYFWGSLTEKIVDLCWNIVDEE